MGTLRNVLDLSRASFSRGFSTPSCRSLHSRSLSHELFSGAGPHAGAGATAAETTAAARFAAAAAGGGGGARAAAACGLLPWRDKSGASLCNKVLEEALRLAKQQQPQPQTQLQQRLQLLRQGGLQAPQKKAFQSSSCSAIWRARARRTGETLGQSKELVLLSAAAAPSARRSVGKAAMAMTMLAASATALRHRHCLTAATCEAAPSGRPWGAGLGHNKDTEEKVAAAASSALTAVLEWVRRLWVPWMLCAMLSVGWANPVLLAANVALLLWGSKQPPHSIYPWLEKRHARESQEKTGLNRMTAKIVTALVHVEVEDFLLFCIARVSYPTRRETVIGALGSWWVVHTAHTAFSPRTTGLLSSLSSEHSSPP